MERKFSMRRISTGDYIWPADDEKTWWRFIRYEERDGTLVRGDGFVIDGTFWSLWRWDGTAEQWSDGEWIDSMQHWTEVRSLLPNRKAALAEAMMRTPVAP